SFVAVTLGCEGVSLCARGSKYCSRAAHAVNQGGAGDRSKIPHASRFFAAISPRSVETCAPGRDRCRLFRYRRRLARGRLEFCRSLMDTSDIKKGLKLMMDGQPYIVVDFQ